MSQSDPIKETIDTGRTADAAGGPGPGTAETSSANQPADTLAAVARPFVEAQAAYCHEMNETWRAAQEDSKSAWCAHARAYEALMNELKQGFSEAQRQYQEGLRAASQSAAEEQRNAAAGAFNRYHTEVTAAQTTAAQKWQDHTRQLETTIGELQQNYARRCGAAYQGYLDALKSALRPDEIEKLPAGVLRYISWVVIHAARFA
jgi:hypothetical protein